MYKLITTKANVEGVPIFLRWSDLISYYSLLLDGKELEHQMSLSKIGIIQIGDILIQIDTL